ncbi:hypothetical protein [Mycolicibacterium fluoranthenivorans]|uniref:Uncharacterized protein n=1 Tax=Mycolicibacterium fluoranthenivorans TaxID=258505 RepID=A0A1G4VF89_9MYCO|nr:hypothetical protein [Mycolicibacterium fluoranthenivorans]SCX05920.1 hypothetical protein SAMN02799620_00781 [Mycolicibacterium fluoranthenivorans]
MTNPEPAQATLTIEGKSIEDWLRAIIHEELTAAITAALQEMANVLGIEVTHGTTPAVQTEDVRGMTCAQAVVVTGKPCQGICTHDTSDPVLPSTIADPDCFR